MDVSGLDVMSYHDGKLAFVSGVLDKLRVVEIITQRLSQTSGRPASLPYGNTAKLMILNIADSHHPLSRLDEYYELKDVAALAGFPVDPEQINDSRFGHLLDLLFAAGPRRVFTEIATHAFLTYGLTIKSLNYDTTSKVMWGEYETDEEELGVVSITFGHSKDKRPDKKQLKVGIGTADGAIVDAKVLSGNHDDKTYNHEVLDDVEATLERFNTSKEEFHYVADSACFTKSNIEKAAEKGIQFITRCPGTVKITSELIDDAWDHAERFLPVTMTNAHGDSVAYLVQDYRRSYKGFPCRFAVCYSQSLETQKRKTLERAAAKEGEAIEKSAKTYKKRAFVCEADAQKEIALLQERDAKTIQYHHITYKVVAVEKKKRGRPKKQPDGSDKSYQYFIDLQAQLDDQRFASRLQLQATFVLVSNDLSLDAATMLTEYRTQSSVEKKFQQLKSPHFVNALYLNKPERIEALTYLILITMMVLSVVERVVRRQMKQEGLSVIGPGKVRMTQPTLQAIVGIFHNASINKITYGGRVERRLIKPLNSSQKTILRCLGLMEGLFTPAFEFD